MEYIILVCGIILADVFSKEYIKLKTPVNQKTEVVKDKLYIWHVKNYGTAWNFFEKHTNVITVLTAFIIGGIAFWLRNLLTFSKSGFDKLSAAFLLGGALGNFFDRLINGCVTDFIFVKKKKAPIFNVADIFIFLGGFMFLIRQLTKK